MRNIVCFNLLGCRLVRKWSRNSSRLLHADLGVLLCLVRRRLSGCPLQGAKVRAYGLLAGRVPPDNEANSLWLAHAVPETRTQSLMM